MIKTIITKIKIGEWPVQIQFWADHKANWEYIVAQFGVDTYQFLMKNY